MCTGIVTPVGIWPARSLNLAMRQMPRGKNMNIRALPYAFVILLAGALLLNACSTRPELEPVPAAQPPGPEAPGPEDPDKPGKPDNPDKPGDKPDEPGEPDEPEDPGKAGPDQVLNATYTPDETSIFRNPE